MMIDFNAIMHDVDGAPIRQDNREDSPKASLGFVAKQVLLAGKDDDKMEPTEKMQLFDLAVAISDSMRTNTPLELEVEDVALIKKRAAPLPVAIIGPMFKMLKG